MKKRSCSRFYVPGATLTYKDKPRFWTKSKYGEDHFPLLDFSRGGAKFVCNNKLKIGREIVVKLCIPGSRDIREDESLEILATVRWVTRNPEASYRFQTGISFHPYGSRKNENSPEVLDRLKAIELAVRIEAEEATPPGAVAFS